MSSKHDRAEEEQPADPNGNGAQEKNPAIASDDIVLPFQTVRSGISGRLVRLGPAVDAILSRHEYPEEVSETLGEAIALTAMLGAALKFEGRFIVQTKTDGPLNMLVTNFETPGSLRAYAGFDATSVLERGRRTGKGTSSRAEREASLLGNGHLAMTIDPNGEMDRYQGIVALENDTLTTAAHTYFRQSEQLPTFLRLAVAKVYLPGNERDPATQEAWTWRAGGLLLQHVASAGGTSQSEREGEALPLTGEGDEDWTRTETLAATVEDHELIDPTLSPERLLYRLFHEEGVRVHEARPVIDHCRCSRERVSGFLRRFASEGSDDLRDPDGSVTVTCEFCNKKYRFEPGEIG